MAARPERGASRIARAAPAGAGAHEVGDRRAAAQLQRRVEAVRAVLAGQAGAAEARVPTRAPFRAAAIAAFPEDGRLVASAGRLRLQALGLMEPAAVNALLAEGVWLSPDLRPPDSPFGRYARQAFPMTSMSRSLDEWGNVLSEMVHDDYTNTQADPRLVLHVYGEPDLPGVRGGVITFTRPERSGKPPPPQRAPYGRGTEIPPDVFLPAPLPATGGPAERDDSRLRRRVRLPEPLPAGRLNYPQALALTARAAGVAILSDDYASTRLRRIDARELADEQPLDELLDRIGAAFHYTWRLEGDLLLFRQARWPFEELAELPERVEKQLAATVARRGGVTPTDLSALATALTREQFRNLAAYYADLWRVRSSYYPARLFRSLSLAQREAAAAPGGLRGTRLRVAPRSAGSSSRSTLPLPARGGRTCCSGRRRSARPASWS